MFLIRILFLTLILFVSSISLSAASNETTLPVNCVESALMFQNTPTDISYLDLANGTIFVKAENVTAGDINGVGFNKKDGYFWGFNHTIKNGTLSRIGKDSQGNLAVDHFIVPTLEINSFTGDVDEKGHLYLKEDRKAKVAVIDLDPNSNTYLTKLRNFNLQTNLGIADWAFNPQDDKLYAVTSTWLYKIEPSTGAFLSMQDINITGSGGYGASFFDKDGNYYIYRNKSGEIFRIDVDAKNPQAIPFATGGIVGNNDGAMCTDVEIRFDFGDAPYLSNLEDDGARHRIKSSLGKTHYLGSKVTTENNGNPSIAADLDEDDDGVTINGLSLQGYNLKSKNAIENITIKTHGNGYLNAWIDWDRDGEFNSSDQIAFNVNGSSGNIELNLDLADIPDIIFNGEYIYARFRYSSEQDLNATGTAPNGEVEDYAIATPNYPTITVENISETEGDSGFKNFTFNLVINQTNSSLENNASFIYQISEGTATLANNDFSSNILIDGVSSELSGSIAIPSDATTNISLTIQVQGDTSLEADETFYLNLTSPMFVNLNNALITGTIKNDDELIMNIERANSDSYQNNTQLEKEAFYTQISGRDFDYSLWTYDKNYNPHPINNTVIKVELLDQNSSQDKELLYSYYKAITTLGSNFTHTIQNDLIIPIATRAASFKISYLVDSNGTLIENISNENDYSTAQAIEGNNEVIHMAKDNFAIRPASYRIVLSDSNNLLQENTTTNRLNLAAEHDYDFYAYATQYASTDIATNYSTYNTEINSSLIFNKNSKLSCRDDKDKILNYQFTNGTSSNLLAHNNVGEYSLSIKDSSWTNIDQYPNTSVQGCISGTSVISNTGNYKSGCDINSNMSSNDTNYNPKHYNMETDFHPYKFDLSNITLSNINGSGNNYVYMNDLENNQNMGIRMEGDVIAKGENDIQLSNFTSSCYAKPVTISIDQNTTTVDGTFSNLATPFQTTEGTLISSKMFINHNNVIDTVREQNLSTAITLTNNHFLDDNNGSSHLQLLYNIAKHYSQTINPILINFASINANSTDSDSIINNMTWTPKGQVVLNQNRTFYFTRVMSHLEYYPKTDKTHIITPLQVEIYCKRLGNRAWCDSTMNLNNAGRNLSSKTDRGWYLAINHDSATDGHVTNLKSNNAEVINVTPSNALPPFVNGRISKIVTFDVDNNITQEQEAKIAIETDIWLRYNPQNILGMPEGTSSYSVIMKNSSANIGIDLNGYSQQSTKNTEHNGKMSW